MKQIGVKYCGGCNPQIHRSRFVEELAQLLSDNCRLETGRPSGQWDAAILVCGCAVACSDRPEVRELARHWVLVSGVMVDWHPVPVEKLAGNAAERLRDLVSCGQGESS